MSVTLRLKSPLFTSWSVQHVKLALAGVRPGEPLALRINGEPAEFQYTGAASAVGAEVMVRLGFDAGEEKHLEFAPAETCSTDLRAVEVPLAGGAAVAAAGPEIRISEPKRIDGLVCGPFDAVAGAPMDCSIHCETALQSARLVRVADGPLLADYELRYDFAERRSYTLHLRCYKAEPYVEVAERFSLGLGAACTWAINASGAFDRIVSHRGPEFESERQPTVEPLAEARPGDVLCRLQMPVLSEYFVPNNRGWFAFFDGKDERRGMLGILGLYGSRWVAPARGMPVVYIRGGRAEWHASLVGGSRHWLLYAGPVEKAHTPESRLVFHRLHAEFNALRLDEHLDLTGEAVYDESCWNAPAIFVGPDIREQARRRCEALPPLREAAEHGERHPPSFRALLDPTPANHRAVYDALVGRFELWVRQFQGHCRGQDDYAKNVIGFSRMLRGMLIAYELLRKDEALDDEQVRRLGAYFVFAARRIMDEGRWPHSRTFLHPDHPESTRGIYAYGGEHAPDRLVWTNCLPNFQSDPLTALAHLSAMFPDHGDAQGWQRKALDDLDRQLTAYTGDSGAYVESINYALYTFSYFVITFRALKGRLGIDYFNDDRVRRYAAWLCRFFGPKDPRWGAYTWPAIGNSRLPQNQAEYLLAYAGELAADDPLRADCIAVYQAAEDHVRLAEHYPLILAAMAPIPQRRHALPACQSEVMDEVGVSMRHEHLAEGESYLFQKIGFAKDHFEGDETAFNWYAKGVPFTMEYGTYTPDAGVQGVHNLVEVPDTDDLRRGYLAGHLFSPVVDFTHCEVPVTLKLLWGRVRTFEEIDDRDGRVAREKTPYFYIGDDNPVGPKAWKVRLLLFVKPDYVALLDRVYGDVPHRWNLHAVADGMAREGRLITAAGRFGLDLHCFVQHPAEFRAETGEFTPTLDWLGDPDAGRAHRQSFVRLYNDGDGLYRTLIFARERGREVVTRPCGQAGIEVSAPEYTDYVFLHTDWARDGAEGIRFVGRTGWVRRAADGQVTACMVDGDEIEAFGVRITGRGPWVYNMDGRGAVELKGGSPRRIVVEGARTGG